MAFYQGAVVASEHFHTDNAAENTAVTLGLTTPSVSVHMKGKATDGHCLSPVAVL